MARGSSSYRPCSFLDASGEEKVDHSGRRVGWLQLGQRFPGGTIVAAGTGVCRALDPFGRDHPLAGLRRHHCMEMDAGQDLLRMLGLRHPVRWLVLRVRDSRRGNLEGES